MQERYFQTCICGWAKHSARKQTIFLPKTYCLTGQRPLRRCRRKPKGIPWTNYWLLLSFSPSTTADTFDHALILTDSLRVHRIRRIDLHSTCPCLTHTVRILINYRLFVLLPRSLTVLIYCPSTDLTLYNCIIYVSSLQPYPKLLQRDISHYILIVLINRYLTSYIYQKKIKT